MKPTLTRILQLIFRRCWVISAFCVVVIAFVTVASYVLPPVYDATAKLLVIPGVEQLPIFTVSSPVTDREASMQLQIENILSEMELIHSRPVLERVVDRLGFEKPASAPEKHADQSVLVRLPEMWQNASAAMHRLFLQWGLVQDTTPREGAIGALAAGLKLELVRSSDVFTVSFAASDPEKAATIVNTLIAEYLAYRRDIYKPVGVVEHFKDRLDEQKAALKTAQDRLRDYQDKYNIINLEDEIDTNLKLYEEAKKGGPFNQQLDQYARRLATLREVAPVIRDLRFDVENSQKLYEQYLQKYDEVSSNAELSDAKFANVRLIEAAAPAGAPIFPHRLFNIELSVVLGLFGGIGFAFMLEYFSGKVNTVEDLEAVDIPALGSVPRLGRRGLLHQLLAPEQGLQTFALIAEQARGSGARVGFVVSGVSPHAGSSTISAGLALALSRHTDGRVLLVDADAGRPRVSQLVEGPEGSSAKPGAAATHGLHDMICPTRYQNIDILAPSVGASGKLDVAALRRLLSNGIANDYDFIVVDAPPVFVAPIALMQGMQGWGSILVVEAGRTSVQVARRARELVARQGIAVFGAVLNKREDSLPAFIYRRL